MNLGPISRPGLFCIALVLVLLWVPAPPSNASTGPSDPPEVVATPGQEGTRESSQDRTLADEVGKIVTGFFALLGVILGNLVLPSLSRWNDRRAVRFAARQELMINLRRLLGQQLDLLSVYEYPTGHLENLLRDPGLMGNLDLYSRLYGLLEALRFLPRAMSDRISASASQDRVKLEVAEEFSDKSLWETINLAMYCIRQFDKWQPFKKALSVDKFIEQEVPRIVEGSNTRNESLRKMFASLEDNPNAQRLLQEMARREEAKRKSKST